MSVLTIVAAVALAVTMGQSGAGNTGANLVAARVGTVRTIRGYSFLTHLLGAVLTGTAVAATILGTIKVGDANLVTVTAAGTLAAVVLLALAARSGIPVAAGLVLVGGLAGAALAADGRGAVVWGGLDGFRPYGVWGTAIAVAVAPVAGLVPRLPPRCSSCDGSSDGPPVAPLVPCGQRFGFPPDSSAWLTGATTVRRRWR